MALVFVLPLPWWLCCFLCELLVTMGSVGLPVIRVVVVVVVADVELIFVFAILSGC